MRHISKDQLEFVRKAMDYMKKHSECLTYSLLDDNYLAIRWGLHDKALLVLKIDGEFKDSIIFEDMLQGATAYPRFKEQDMETFALDVLMISKANHWLDASPLVAIDKIREELIEWKKAHGK